MQRREFLTGMGLLAAFGARSVSAVVNDILPPKGVVLDYKVLFNGSDIGYQRVKIRDHDAAGHVVVEHETKLEHGPGPHPRAAVVRRETVAQAHVLRLEEIFDTRPDVSTDGHRPGRAMHGLLEECLDLVHEEAEPHVRRLVSEGTRPRLPWAARLRLSRPRASGAGSTVDSEAPTQPARARGPATTTKPSVSMA